MNNQNALPLRLHRPHPSFPPIINSLPPQSPRPPQTTNASQPPKKIKSRLRAEIFAKLSLVHPNTKATIVTSNTNRECYAHVIDEEEKARYSSGAQQSIEAALEVLLVLVEEDVVGLGGLKGMKRMELGESEGEEEEQQEEMVDHEMEVD